MMKTTPVGEQGFNSTAATSDFIVYPWVPAGNVQDLGPLDFTTLYPAPEEKPKRKSRWLLKQMKRRGHQK